MGLLDDAPKPKKTFEQFIGELKATRSANKKNYLIEQRQEATRPQAQHWG